VSDTIEDWESDELPGEEVLSDRVKETARRSPRYMRFAIGMVRDPDVPMKTKAALILGGSYVVSPIDLIPGFIPVLGQIDDLVVMMAALGAATRMTPVEVVDKHIAAVGLTHEDMARDVETAELAGRWAARKGFNVAQAVAEKSLSIVIDATQRGYAMISGRLKRQSISRSP
jgi:uncharacterized membrane protein YkvA (DUF1232 family)